MTVLGELLVLSGALFILISSVGVLKMPYFLMRLQVASKATAFGIILVLLGDSVLIDDWGFEWRALIIFVFLLISTPISAHALAQAAKKLNHR